MVKEKEKKTVWSVVVASNGIKRAFNFNNENDMDLFCDRVVTNMLRRLYCQIKDSKNKETIYLPIHSTVSKGMLEEDDLVEIEYHKLDDLIVTPLGFRS